MTYSVTRLVSDGNVTEVFETIFKQNRVAMKLGVINLRLHKIWKEEVCNNQFFDLLDLVMPAKYRV